MMSSGTLIQTGLQGQTNSSQLNQSSSFTLTQPTNVYSKQIGFRILNPLFFLFSSLKFTTVTKAMLENLCLDKRKNKFVKFSENLFVLSIFIQYSIGFSVWNRSQTAAVYDDKPKTIQNYIHIGNGTTPDLTTSYAISGQPFMNVQNPATQFAINGFYYNTGSEMVNLPAGTYSIHLYGLVSSSDGATFLKTSDAFSTDYGGSSKEYLRVVAFY